MTLGQELASIRVEVAKATNSDHLSQLAYVESRIQRAQQVLIELQRQREQLRVYLLHEQEVDTTSRDDIVFTNLLRMPQIKDILIEDGVVFVTTHEIVTTYKRKKYPLGEFKIAIRFAEGFITLNNLTRKRDDYDHPHVLMGSPCYGNIGTEVSRCITSCDFGVLIPLLVQFLETVNEGEWYTHIDRWEPDNEIKGGATNE